MGEILNQHNYRSDRVLIETARMYRPLFSPATVYLTGAQVEMLRNMTQYLNRPNTYVELYERDYYYAPSAAQFDGIQEIVADLEEKLMGNPNTIWGFSDTYEQSVQDVSDVNGTFVVDLAVVPANEVWRVHGVGLYRTTVPAATGAVQVYNGIAAIALEQVDIPLAGEMYPNTREITMAEDYYIKGIFKNSVIGETVIVAAWGYKMVVP